MCERPCSKRFGRGTSTVENGPGPLVRPLHAGAGRDRTEPRGAFELNRSEYLRLLCRMLGRRPVVYFGTRGADARSLADLPNFECIFSQTAPADLAGVQERCLERMTGTRVDLDTYSVDDDRSPAVAEFRSAMLTVFEGSTAVVPYRSGALLASAWFPRSERVLHLGNFHEHQACFEHKPWVETQLAAAGIRTVPWRYFADSERSVIEEMLATRPLVLRSNHSHGGTGVRYVKSVAELNNGWPEHLDGFLAVAPFLDGVPLNVNGVVFPDGTVSRHGVSVQLVGIPRCTTRRFGYCGNDFGAAAALDSQDVSEVDGMLAAVGQWLSRHGYRGAFGIDAILTKAGVHLVEVNPRFQGSSRLSAAIDVDAERADMFLAHVGAFLGAPVPDTLRLTELAKRPPRAHLVVHADAEFRARNRRVEASGCLADLMPAEGVRVKQGAMSVDLVFGSVITDDGLLLSSASRALADVDG